MALSRNTRRIRRVFFNCPRYQEQWPHWACNQTLALLVAFVLAIGFGQFSVNAAEPSAVFDVAYGPEPQQKLDLCTTSRLEPGPSVILIHGGGWSAGKKEDFRPLCRLFAANGVTAATVEYRLADGSAAGAWPAQIKDVAIAANWLKEHAGRYGIDTERICLFGHSAGAQMALMLGTTANIGSEFKPACIVDNWGPTDLSYPPYNGALRKLFPGSNYDLHKNVASVSPIRGIDKNFPPTFVAQGTLDDVVPPQQSEILLEQLRASGVVFEFLAFSGGHEMDGLDPAEKKSILDREIAFVKRAGRKP